MSAGGGGSDSPKIILSPRPLQEGSLLKVVSAADASKFDRLASCHPLCVC